ncbi:unnamed protein product (macronuclear) [Paramecium tetraurelia]|uniref:Cache domain-containing protein n=1 Tax=Paramecium tetraurelia TaxID=5888 RepID=A0DG35_PARTE|nr:uncharacterized protein GSPATT00002130001 [Paramecium tetraurelia]CAK82002.1 unnamed protein product [Paramecium tetraurelia]|eukprot:XP_001449399.1 hypothetical protein (macronuclear) [Paramecium tetraurelia strain d4-2]
MILNKLKQQHFWYINKNWRIKNQILIIQIVSSIFVFILLASSIIISQLIIQKSIEESSEKIFVKQTLQQLNSVWLHKNNLQQLIRSASQQIQIVQSFNQFIEKTSILTMMPLQCLNQPNTNDSYCYSSSYCFGLFGDWFNQTHLDQLSQVFAVTSLLTQFRIAVDNTQALYFSHANQAQFYTINQGFYFNQGFKPHLRPWYLYHLNYTLSVLNNSNLIVYGKPYEIFTGGIRIPMTSNLLNIDQGFEGVIAKDIDFNQTSAFKLLDQETTLIIINCYGQVIYSRLYDQLNQSLYSIFDEIYTGFNETDFQQIMNYHNHKNFSNSCNLILEQDNVLCRYNSKLDDFCIIQTAQIANTPYILVLFQDSKNIKMTQEEQYSLINNEQSKITQQNIIMYLLLTLFVLLIAQLMSSIMLKQLNLLICYTKYNIYDNWIFNLSKMINLKQKYLIQSQEITNLYFSVVELIHYRRPSKKNKQCSTEEKNSKELNKQRNQQIKLKISNYKAKKNSISYDLTKKYFDLIKYFLILKIQVEELALKNAQYSLV